MQLDFDLDPFCFPKIDRRKADVKHIDNCNGQATCDIIFLSLTIKWMTLKNLSYLQLLCSESSEQLRVHVQVCRHALQLHQLEGAVVGPAAKAAARLAVDELGHEGMVGGAGREGLHAEAAGERAPVGTQGNVVLVADVNIANLLKIVLF